MALRGVAPFSVPPAPFLDLLTRPRRRKSTPFTPPYSIIKPSPSSASNCTASSASDDEAESDSVQNDDGQVALGFSFSGGGWLMCYIFGVAETLREAGIHRDARFIGTSAGALTAFGLIMDIDFETICNGPLQNYVAEARGTWTGAFRMREYLVDVLNHHANLHEYERCHEDPRKLTVVYTSLSAWEARRKSTFETREHLIDTLLASCCATPVAGLPFKFQDEWIIDGGILENQPEFDASHGVQRTVKMTPNFYDTSADIRPSQYIPPWWSMYPPSHEELLWVFRLGRHDGLVWCEREGFMESTSSRSTQDDLGGRSSSLTRPSSWWSRHETSAPALTSGTSSIQHFLQSWASWDQVGTLWSLMAIFAVGSLVADDESTLTVKVFGVVVLGGLHVLIWDRR